MFRLTTFIFFSFTIDVMITEPKNFFRNINLKNIRTWCSVGVYRWADLWLQKCEKLAFPKTMPHRTTLNWLNHLKMLGNVSFSHFRGLKSARRCTPTLNRVRKFFESIFLKNFCGFLISASIVNEKKNESRQSETSPCIAYSYYYHRLRERFCKNVRAYFLVGWGQFPFFGIDTVAPP